MVLAKALVEKEKDDNMEYDAEKGHMLPQIPLHKARQIMTRADFIQSYDSINIFTIDSRAMVRADSVPMMNAFREICALEYDTSLATASTTTNIISEDSTIIWKQLWTVSQQLRVWDALASLQSKIYG
jgi:hypothetical protein